MPFSVPLPFDTTLRLMTSGDAGPLLAANERNRRYLAPWEPEREESYFSIESQTDILNGKLEQLAAGAGYPLLMVKDDAIVGQMTLSGIVRGPFQSASLGYWVDRDHAGQGLASAALHRLVAHCRDELDLHRLEAGTLLHNARSQAVLRKSGFAPIGIAEKYLKIAGQWQDHLLFQNILTS